MKYFISDLHLSADTPETTALFLRFLAQKKEATALYILGDFFDTYVGDHQSEPYPELCAALKTYSKVTPIYFMVGNRDFLIGKQFAKDSGCILINDPLVIYHGKQKILLMHGDSLCTKDKSYQRYRRIIHNKVLQWGFLHLPLNIRRWIVNKMRQQSQQLNHKKPKSIMDVSPNAVEAIFNETQAYLLIHGHTHRPSIHSHRVGNKTVTRMVLTDWDSHGGYGILRDSGTFSLEHFT